MEGGRILLSRNSEGGVADEHPVPPMKKQQVIAVAGALIIVYTCLVAFVFLDRHLKVPQGNYPENLEGHYLSLYEGAKKPGSQGTWDYGFQVRVPEALRGGPLAITSERGTMMRVVHGGGNALSLKQGADGLYFSQNISPVGARIIPGIGREWNEGRIHSEGDRVFIDGYLLKEGLMLFVIPFKSEIQWRVELKRDRSL